MKVKTLKKKAKFNSALSHYLIPHVSIVLIAISSHAQSQTPDTSVKRFVEITPSLSISETWTDNVRAGSAQSDYITEISPGLLLTSETGFLKGYFDYKANNISYVRNKSSNKLQSALNANLQMEVVENFLFIDAGGQISQQSISILGPSSPVNSLINENRAEVSSYKISPSIKGQFLGFANYEGRISRSINTSLRSNIYQRDLSFKLSGNTLIQGLGWLFDSNRQTIDLAVDDLQKPIYFWLALHMKSRLKLV